MCGNEKQRLEEEQNGKLLKTNPRIDDENKLLDCFTTWN
jgi:hypothetical protein